MSTIWTPSGEHRVPKEPGDGEHGRAACGTTKHGGSRCEGTERARPGACSLPGERRSAEDNWEPTPEEARQAKEELDAMRQQLVQAPVELVDRQPRHGPLGACRAPSVPQAPPLATGAAGDRRAQRPAGRAPGPPGRRRAVTSGRRSPRSAWRSYKSTTPNSARQASQGT